jgi:DNA repair photolyase
MLAACYGARMANIQVKNVPEKLHNRLRRYAREQHCTLGEIVLEAIEREVGRREWHKRFSGRPKTHLRNTAAELLDQERRQRDSDLR